MEIQRVATSVRLGEGTMVGDALNALPRGAATVKGRKEGLRGLWVAVIVGCVRLRGQGSSACLGE